MVVNFEDRELQIGLHIREQQRWIVLTSDNVIIVTFSIGRLTIGVVVVIDLAQQLFYFLASEGIDLVVRATDAQVHCLLRFFLL